MLGTDIHDTLGGEGPTLFQVLKMNKWREARTVRKVMDRSGNVVSSHKGILHTFASHFKDKYGPIKIDGVV